MTLQNKSCDLKETEHKIGSNYTRDKLHMRNGNLQTHILIMRY